ncbi:MAG: CIA30 family protein [Ahniella sp.]|nr:CIA30 family protein [Ahniella sp.]
MKPLISFNANPNEPSWRAVNDGVMGGRSSGGPEITNGRLRFEGTLSLENNGGFSSVRTVGKTFDLSQASAITLKVRGDGRTYQLRLATDARFRGIAVSYGSSFATVADAWTEVRLPLAELKPTIRGMALDGPPLDAAHVREIGLLIGDKREGAFWLEVDWIGVEAVESLE